MSDNPDHKPRSLGCFGYIGMVSLILLASCLTTEGLLKLLYGGELVAVRILFPFSFVERDLGGRSRWEVRCLEHSRDFLESFFSGFMEANKKILSRPELEYRPVMEIPSEETRALKESSRSGVADGEREYFRYLSNALNLDNDSPSPTKTIPVAASASASAMAMDSGTFLRITYPYLDWNGLPLVFVKSRNDLMAFFPYLNIGMEATGRSDSRHRQTPGVATGGILDRFPALEIPGGALVSITMAYSFNRFGQKSFELQRKMNWALILVPFFITVFSLPFFLAWKHMIRWPLRLFAVMYPIAMFMEIAQPTCYLPGRGRLIIDNLPAMQDECRRIIRELSQNGTIDGDTKALLDKAMENPASRLYTK